MRHKYQTRALILAKTPLGEANASLALLSSELGLLSARAQGIRKSGARLVSALQILNESELTLVRGTEGWRVTGASLGEAWFLRLSYAARLRAGRLAGLLLRLAAHDSVDATLYPIVTGALAALVEQPESSHDAVECLAVLRVLSALGLATEEGQLSNYDQGALVIAERERPSLIARINRGIEASGL